MNKSNSKQMWLWVLTSLGFYISLFKNPSIEPFLFLWLISSIFIYKSTDYNISEYVQNGKFSELLQDILLLLFLSSMSVILIHLYFMLITEYFSEKKSEPPEDPIEPKRSFNYSNKIYNNSYSRRSSNNYTQRITSSVKNFLLPPKPNSNPIKVKKTYTKQERDKHLAEKSKSENLCQIDPSHKTFISRKTGKPFLEAHHIIPVNQQNKLRQNLDIEANIIALCPNCHRKVHYGTANDKKKCLELMYEQKLEELQKTNINITLEDLYKFYKI